MPKKKSSLKMIASSGTLKTLSARETNTHDNYEAGKKISKDEIQVIRTQGVEDATEKAVDLLKDMRQVQKIAKLYCKPAKLCKNILLGGEQDIKRILKSKYKCLISPNVFSRRSKVPHSGSPQSKENKSPNFNLDDGFWERVNESLIKESCRYEEPSKELMDLVGNILTE